MAFLVPVPQRLPQRRRSPDGDEPGRTANPAYGCSRYSRFRVFAWTAANVCGPPRTRAYGLLQALRPLPCKTTRKRS